MPMRIIAGINEIVSLLFSFSSGVCLLNLVSRRCTSPFFTVYFIDFHWELFVVFFDNQTQIGFARDEFFIRKMIVDYWVRHIKGVIYLQ